MMDTPPSIPRYARHPRPDDAGDVELIHAHFDALWRVAAGLPDAPTPDEIRAVWRRMSPGTHIAVITLDPAARRVARAWPLLGAEVAPLLQLVRQRAIADAEPRPPAPTGADFDATLTQLSEVRAALRELFLNPRINPTEAIECSRVELRLRRVEARIAAAASPEDDRLLLRGDASDHITLARADGRAAGNGSPSGTAEEWVEIARFILGAASRCDGGLRVDVERRDAGWYFYSPRNETPAVTWGGDGPYYTDDNARQLAQAILARFAPVEARGGSL